jgi:hypothetical protein
MEFIVMDIAQGREILDGVLASIFVMLLVVEFQHLTGVVSSLVASAPPTLRTPKAIALEHGDSHGIGNGPIVLVGLSVLLEKIDANREVRAAATLSHDRPAVFRAQFSHATSPLFFVSGQIFQFLARYLLSHISSKVLDDLGRDR